MGAGASLDSHAYGRRREPPEKGRHHARRLAGGPGADLRAPQTPVAGLRAAAGEPSGRVRAAGVAQVGHRSRDRPAPPGVAAATRARNGRGDAGAGRHRIWPVADPRRCGAAGHHGHAAHRAGVRAAAAGELLRFDQERHPHFADHVRRRGHPQSRRNGTGTTDRGCAYGRGRAGGTVRA